MENNGRVSLIRYHTGEVRLVWRILLAVVMYVTAAVVLRFIPIFLSTVIKTSRGIDKQEALEASKTMVFEHPIWSTTIVIINAFISFLLVWFLMRVIEKRSFRLKDVGLDRRRGSLLCLVFGALFALLINIAGTFVDRVLGSSTATMETFLAGLTVSAVVRNIALWIPMGFSEELLFRGYVQTRLVERYGGIWGILIGSIVFTLLHLPGRELSPFMIFNGIILWSAVGALYHWSRSLYLVGMFHGVANILLNILPFKSSDTASLIVHVFALLLIVVVGLYRAKSSRTLSDRVVGGN